MNIDVFCDESRPDLFASKRNTLGRFLLIGSVWLPTERRPAFKEEVKALREKHGVYGEAKWRCVAPSRVEFYLEFVDWFFEKRELCRFRCIVVEAGKVDLPRFHDADHELGFYKFYYQLLHHWILDFNCYRVFLDHKRDKDRTRLKVLRRCLTWSNLTTDIDRVQALDSRHSQFIQLADLLTGAAAAHFSGGTCSPARKALIARIEDRLGRPIGPTPRAEQKYNVFKIDLSGGW
jgi:hypothetical protein